MGAPNWEHDLAPRELDEGKPLPEWGTRDEVGNSPSTKPQPGSGSMQARGSGDPHSKDEESGQVEKPET